MSKSALNQMSSSLMSKMRLTKNAQLFRDDMDDDLSREERIRGILDGVCHCNNIPVKKFLINEFRQEKEVKLTAKSKSIKVKCSTRLFQLNRQVYFIEDKSVRDVLHAFIVIIEFKEFLVVLSQNCYNTTNVVQRYFSPLKELDFYALYTEDDVEFQKVSLRQMTISGAAMRGKAFEARDLKGVLSAQSNRRSIPFAFKVRDHNKTQSVTLRSSRCVESSSRMTLSDIIVWSAKLLLKIKKAQGSSDFLDSFAKQVTFESLADLEVSAVLIDTHLLGEMLSEADLLLQGKGDHTRKLSEKIRNKLLLELERVYEVDASGCVIGLNDRKDRETKLKANKKSYSMRSKLLKSLKYEEDGSLKSLESLINKERLFTLTFYEPQYLYSFGRCYEDGGLIGGLKELLEVLEPLKSLDSVTSEKGNVSNNTLSFGTKSVFRKVEDAYKTSTFLFCDDYGTEWADHIALMNKSDDTSVHFIHSKHKDKSTTGASLLHEVVSQALKNIGNMSFTKNQFLKKYDSKFKNVYRSSKIQRVRIGKGSRSEVAKTLDAILIKPEIKRVCTLACSFLSKKQLMNEFKQIENGKRVNGYVYQLIWLLSSYVATCKEFGIQPRIWCKK